MSPALFLVVALVLSVLGSLVVWLFLRDRPASTDAMADFRRTMSALDPNADKDQRPRGTPKGSGRKG